MNWLLICPHHLMSLSPHLCNGGAKKAPLFYFSPICCWLGGGKKTPWIFYAPATKVCKSQFFTQFQFWQSKMPKLDLFQTGGGIMTLGGGVKLEQCNFFNHFMPKVWGMQGAFLATVLIWPHHHVSLCPHQSGGVKLEQWPKTHPAFLRLWAWRC